MHGGMQYDPIQGQKVTVTSPSKLEIRPFSTVISSAIYNSSWQLTTDSETKSTMSKFVQAGFLIFVIVFVSHVFELGTVRPRVRLSVHKKFLRFQ